MTTPAWVPAGATIHIDLVGGTPQGRAWVNGVGEVDVATLLGYDFNIESSYGNPEGNSSEYNTDLLTPAGYVYPPSYRKVLGVIGAARASIFAGTTLRFVIQQIGEYNPNQVDLVLLSGFDTYNGLELDTYIRPPPYSSLDADGYSWGGDFYEVVDPAAIYGLGQINVIAVTTTPTRFEFALNGGDVGGGGVPLTTADYPTVGDEALVCALFDLYGPDFALQAITFFDLLPTTAGLSALSVRPPAFAPTVGVPRMDGAGGMVGISVAGAAIAQMDGAASMDTISTVLGHVPVTYTDTILELLISGGIPLSSTHYKHALSQNLTSHEITRTVKRSKLAIQSAFTLHAAISYRMQFVKVLREIATTLTDSIGAHTRYSYAFTTPVSVKPTLAPKWHTALRLIQNLLVNQTTAPKFIWGRGLTEVFNVSAAVGTSGHYRLALTQLFKLIEVEGFKLSHPVVLNQNINLSLSLVGKYGLKLLQKLLVATAPLPAIHYHLMLASRVIAEDILEHLVKGILAELFTVHPALGRHFTANSSLAQLLTIHPALNTKLVLKIVGNIQLSPEQLVHMIYRGDPLLDGVVITALYISPSGTTTTWVVNTRTNAVTEYLNYDFRSFTLMGNKYIAAGAEGLYELDGDTDDGELIVSRMMSGYLQLNEKKMFGIKGAYVAIRGGGRFYLKLISGDGREYIYELRAQPNLMTTKVKVGKGISTTYMAFELITEGQDFDLDSIEFIPMTRGRRV